MGPQRHPCVRGVARGVLARGRRVPPVCVRGGGDCIPGLPSESLQDARARRGLAEDEEKGEEGGKGGEGCQGDTQRTEDAAEAATEHESERETRDRRSLLATMHLLRRLYASTALPPHAARARAASTPLAVRARRLKKPPALLPPPDSPLTPTEHATYMRHRAKGQLRKIDGQLPSPAEWLDALNARRTRLRGIVAARVVGQKIYLPNTLFKLVRNHTPSGSYNPYEATFRIPPSVTKTDVRSYLSAVYGVKTTYIRTANYISPLRRTPLGLRPVGSHRTYKRAVVGLVDPFYYPQNMADMDKWERTKREKWLEERFALKLVTRMRRHELIRMSQAGSKTWRLTGHVRRDKILQSIAKRRALDARDLDQVEAELAQRREAGHPILRDKGRRAKPAKKQSKALTV
jgi:large subunit ribosomal protein L23